MRSGFAFVCLLSTAFVASCLWVTDLDALRDDGALDGSGPRNDAERIDASSSGGSEAGGPTDAGDAAADGDAAPRCAGRAGPTPVALPLGYCVDRTEVSGAQYREFLAEKAGDTSGQDPRCAGNTTYQPQFGMPSVSKDPLPIRYVDFCDALAYCSWAGKRVCGSRDAEPLGIQHTRLASRSQWFAACSRNADGVHTYPYGTDEVPGRCGDIERRQREDAGELFAAGSMPECEGGYPGLLDMSGNVSEWEDACSAPDDGGTLRCAVRGGAYYHQGTPLRCEHVDLAAIDNGGAGFGIRCCSELQ